MSDSSLLRRISQNYSDTAAISQLYVNCCNGNSATFSASKSCETSSSPRRKLLKSWRNTKRHFSLAGILNRTIHYGGSPRRSMPCNGANEYEHFWPSSLSEVVSSIRIYY